MALESVRDRKPDWIRDGSLGREQLQRLVLETRCARLLDTLEPLEQARVRRGARARRGLIGTTMQLQRSLFRSYTRLEREIVATLRGRADDVTTYRLTQAEPALPAVLRAYGLTPAEGEEPVERDRLPAVLLLLLLWRRRHVAIADDFVGSTFQRGRQDVLKRLRQANAQGDPATRRLREEVLARYQEDIERLYTGLLSGTPRRAGLTAIMEAATTLGITLVQLRSLFLAEAYRLEMFAESLVWTAWSEGFRAGAVDGTREMLLLGLDAPRFRWMGPVDTRACPPCLAQFGEPIVASGVDAIPAPQDICRWGRGCRHWWELE